MQQSLSLSTKSFGTTNGGANEVQKVNFSTVNWVSVINFLENEYTKSTIRQKQWFLEKKILNQQILKLKSQLNAVQTLNSNLNNRIKLLQNALKRQKFLKGPNNQNKQQKSIQKIRTIEEVQKYFQKNGWSLNEKPKQSSQNVHKKFLNKVLQDVGINFDKIQERCRKMSLNSVDNQKLQRKDKTQTFQHLINDISKIKISSKIKVNCHLDAVRGMYTSKNTSGQNIMATVSEDCLLKLWSVEQKNTEKSQSIQPLLCLRQHTGQLFALDGGQSNPFSNDLVLFTGGTQQFVKIWYSSSIDKPLDLKCIGSFMNDNKSQADELAQQQNEIIWSLKYKQKKILTSASDGIVRLFKTQIQSIDQKISPEVTLIHQFAQKNYLHTTIEWVGQRGFLSSCSNSPRIHLWDTQSGKLMQRYLYQIDKPKQEKAVQKKQQNITFPFQINSLKYVSEYKTIYAGCQDKSVRIFSYNENKMVKKLDTGINDSINCIQFYKNNFVIAGSQNGSLKVWDRRTYKLLIDQSSHKIKYDEGILCMKTTEQGIFTGGADGVVNFYCI